jgi:hypothetical protein
MIILVVKNTFFSSSVLQLFFSTVFLFSLVFF